MLEKPCEKSLYLRLIFKFYKSTRTSNIFEKKNLYINLNIIMKQIIIRIKIIIKLYIYNKTFDIAYFKQNHINRKKKFNKNFFLIIKF